MFSLLRSCIPIKKATLKDIAKAADVSVATVSYVLNNVANQTIPDETKCRVLDAAKRLNYVPNLAARSLVKQKSGLIGILINRVDNEGIWRQLRYSSFVNRLERLLTDRGYHVVLSSLDATNPKLDIISERKLDGVFVVDVKQENFHLISSHFSVGVPLIVVDSIIEDSLFYKVNYDYEDAFSKAKASSLLEPGYVIIDSFNNAELAQSIRYRTGIDPRLIHVMEDEEKLKRFLEQNAEKGGIVLNELVGAIAAKYVNPSKLSVICTADCPEILPIAVNRIQYDNRKSEEAFQLMMKLLDNPMNGPEHKYIEVKASQR
ncbi:LacI family DNA-binding transcriptional regulator [Paenibacillus prosopidis]|uniref:DNA-binding LacI/PurR family transcriptional regulator n=1 Tax=Paenibacillus prosopidis TaxID=630520 RepID=A0A368W7W3_9BACL|nr:LacI family DNA-binding transcriptional regulator [Paenibacillus prosopidis]RCW51811.1 DNA-binding LacI/PurR family transcriptional regulator [Paenibacillus prosopidis]